MLSDFYDAEDETWRELKRAARRGHDVAMLQVMSRREIELPYTGDIEFEDLETGHEPARRLGYLTTGYRAASRTFSSAGARARAARASTTR